MANIELKGNQYQNVPYVDLPTTESGTARFWEDILKMGVLRNDAELVQTWSKDSMFVADDGGTIPAYSTSAQTLAASAALTPTYTIDTANYNYFFLERALTTPVYSTATPAKGRNEYQFMAGIAELIEYPANSFVAASGKKYASRIANIGSIGHHRLLYWSSASAVAVYTGSTYGVAQAFVAPTIASVTSSVLTAHSPTLQMRGNATYLTSAVWNTITDLRVQYIIELYRVPKSHLNLDGWGMFQQGSHILDCVSNGGTLT